MKHPYNTARYGWRYVLILYRLAGLEPDTPLRVSPAKDTSLNTIRAKLFHGRQHIFTSKDASLAAYSALAATTTISTHGPRIEISRDEAFDRIISDLPADTFRLTYNLLIPALTSHKTFSFPTPNMLTPPQVAAIREYLLSIPGVLAAQVSANSILVAR